MHASSSRLYFLFVVLCACGLAATSKPVNTAEQWRRTVRNSPKSRSIDHWEQLVKQSAAHLRSARDVEAEDVGIVNLQEYYKDIFESKHGWGGDDQEYYYRKLHALEAYLENNPEKAEAFEKKQEKLILRTQSKVKSIPNRFIVLLSDEATDYEVMRTIQVLKNAQLESDGKLVADHIEPIWYAGRGFTATLGERVAELVEKHPLVNVLEQDVALRRSGGTTYTEDDTDSLVSVQERLVWNLDRLDQHDNSLDNQYNPIANGSGVEVYVFDTGLRYSHQEFSGRALYAGFDTIDLLTGSQQKGADCNGHGTHCGATIGGVKFGVAKEVMLYSVRVLDCQGTGAVSGIVTAMDKVLGKRTASSPSAVFSMSLGVENSVSLNSASDNAARHNVLVVAAAGNQGGDACKASPGNADSSVSVGATDKHDVVQSFSNIGKCMDVFAPGQMIESAGYDCDDCVAIKSGTSMAAPHVTGYVAILLEIHPQMTPKQLKQAVIKNASTEVIVFEAKSQYYASSAKQQLVSSTPDRLLYVGPDNNNKVSQ